MASRTTLGILKVRAENERRVVDAFVGRIIRLKLELSEGDPNIMNDLDKVAESIAAGGNRLDMLIRSIDAKLR